MLRTALCGVLGIEHPIIQGPLGGPWPPSVGLAAAVSEAGALGSLPTTLRRPEQVREDAAQLRDLTSRPFAINHTMRPFIEDVFQVMVDAAPPVISFALGRSPELIKRAQDAGALFVQQVHSVQQAQRQPRTAPTSSSPREARQAGSGAHREPWCSSPRSPKPSIPFLWPPRVGSGMAAGWRRRSRSGRPA